jgi:hypothetical protein
MPTALYLYNSQETASIVFFNQLRVKLEAAGWTAKADFKAAVSGQSGPAMGEVITQMRAADAIVYAVGPKGPGNTQATVEAPAALDAQIAAAGEGRELKVVPILVAGGEIARVPEVLRYLAVQMENTARGGEDVLSSTLRAILGDDAADAVLKGPASTGTRLTSEAKVQQVVSKIAKNRENGLAVFISPYAVSEVHQGLGPGDIGHALLKEKLPFLEVDDLLAHPFVAAAARALLEQGSFQETWTNMQSLFAERAAEPLQLHKRLASLAAAWIAARKAPAEAGARYKGLLFVTTDLDMRLERALWEQNVNFGRLRMSRPEDDEPDADGEVPIRAVYERPSPRSASSTLAFIQQTSTEQGARNVESTGAIETHPDYEPVMVLKLLDCISNDVCPPLATVQFLAAIRHSRLPGAITGLLQRAPFLMLGGGLLHPLVSFALATHFLPNFVKRGPSMQPVPRFVALHSARGPGDKLRLLEEEADRNELNWTGDLFDMERLNYDLLFLLQRLADEITAAASPAAAAP